MNFVTDHARFIQSDSTFSLCSKEELQAACDKILKMKADGTLDAWFEKKEADRKKKGQSVTVYAEKI